MQFSRYKLKQFVVALNAASRHFGHGLSPYKNRKSFLLTCKHDASLLFDFCTSKCFRGDGEIRTLDPLLARQVLSQLSYTPTAFAASGLKWTRTIDLTLIRRAL